MDKKEEQVQIALGTFLDNEWKLFLKTQLRVDKAHSNNATAARDDDDHTYLKYRRTATKCRLKEDMAKLRWYEACIKVYGENVSLQWENQYECLVNYTIRYRRQR